MMVGGDLNPYRAENMTEDDLLEVDHPFARDMKHFTLPDPTKSKTLHRLYNHKSSFMPNFKDQIDEMITKLKDDYEFPFDEVYHKEKHAIEAVVQAERKLREK